MSYRISRGMGAYSPPTSTGYATISYMQQALNYLGYTDNSGAALAVDDSMSVGGPSWQALKKFQKAAGLTVDGQYGSQSWNALKAAVAAKQVSPAPAPAPVPSPTPFPSPAPAPVPTPCPAGQALINGVCTAYAGVTPKPVSTSTAGSSSTLYVVGGVAIVALVATFLFLKKKR